MITWKRIKDILLWGIDGHDPLENKPETKSTVVEVENTNSTITFEIDKELNVTVHTRINKDIILPLLDQNYINANGAEDEGSIQVAFVLIANEITEQLIEEVNKNAEELTNRSF